MPKCPKAAKTKLRERLERAHRKMLRKEVETFATPQPLDRNEIIATAQKVLTEWKKDPNATYEHSRFFIDSEVSRSPTPISRRLYDNMRLNWSQNISRIVKSFPENAGWALKTKMLVDSLIQGILRRS